MKPLGPIRSIHRADRFTYGCPLSKTYVQNGKLFLSNDCKNPCSNAFYGRKVNIAIDEEYRINSAFSRDSDKWKTLYRTRTVCERAIGQLKDFINIRGSHIQNTTSLKSTILLTAITQLVGVLLMVRSNYLYHLRAFKTVA